MYLSTCLSNFSLLNALFLNNCSQEILFIILFVSTTHLSCANSLTDAGILCSLLNHYTSTTNSVFCVGDFNYLYIDWSVPFSADIETHVKFLSCTLNCGILQMDHQPTSGLNCLDLVLVSVPSLICNLCVIEPIAVSCDHSTVDISILISYMPIQPRLSYPDFAKADYLLQHIWIVLIGYCYSQIAHKSKALV